jgi:hypothetical protein
VSFSNELNAQAAIRVAAREYAPWLDLRSEWQQVATTHEKDNAIANEQRASAPTTCDGVVSPDPQSTRTGRGSWSIKPSMLGMLPLPGNSIAAGRLPGTRKVGFIRGGSTR